MQQIKITNTWIVFRIRIAAHSEHLRIELNHSLARTTSTEAEREETIQQYKNSWHPKFVSKSNLVKMQTVVFEAKNFQKHQGYGDWHNFRDIMMLFLFWNHNTPT